MGVRSVDDFFTMLERWRVFSGTRPNVEFLSWDFEKVSEFIGECLAMLPYHYQAASSNFVFTANSSMSGGRWPCAHIGCRLERIESLVQFAALYSDKVLIADPFDGIGQTRDNERARLMILDNLSILVKLKPLIEIGIIGVAPSIFPLCAECDASAREGSSDLRRQLEEAVADLAQECTQRLTFSSGRRGDDAFVVVTGPDDLVENGEHSLHHLPNRIARNIGRDGRHIFYPRERRFIVRNLIVDPIVSDLISQQFIARFLRVSYLSNRRRDVDLLRKINKGAERVVSDKMVRALEHSLPVVLGLGPEEIMKLRRRDGEAFQVYRDALDKVLKSASGDKEESVLEAFNDLVRPEINKIEATVASIKKMARSAIRERIIFGSGLITVGLLANIVPTGFGAAASWLGGAAFANDLLREVSKLIKEPAEVRQSDFYFLWKMHRQAKSRDCRKTVRARRISRPSGHLR
jgi:hypothetical protein